MFSQPYFKIALYIGEFLLLYPLPLSHLAFGRLQVIPIYLFSFGNMCS
nr:MAG TPA: hypothetical protein [Caudoviricetes sp.]